MRARNTANPATTFAKKVTDNALKNNKMMIMWKKINEFFRDKKPKISAVIMAYLPLILMNIWAN